MENTLGPFSFILARHNTMATPEIAESLHLFETAGLDDPQPLQEVQLVPSSVKKVLEFVSTKGGGKVIPSRAWFWLRSRALRRAQPLVISSSPHRFLSFS